MAKESSEKDKSIKRALVVACYPWEWQQVLSFEGALELKSLNMNVHYLDLSNFKYSLDRAIYHRVKGHLQNGFHLRKQLELEGISTSNPVALIIRSKLQRRIYEILKLKCPSDVNERWNVVYPGLVDITNDIKVHPSTHARTVREILLDDFFFVELLKDSRVTRISFDEVLIVNGRFPLNRAAAEFFREEKVKVRFIEFGSNRNKFQIYDTSPHSIKNRKELFEKFIQSIEISSSRVHEQGTKFFASRGNFDVQANVNWTRKMNTSEVPQFKKGKLVATFFTTSEKEFSGVRDEATEGGFKNQFDALNSLILALGRDWEIYVRRHPQASDSIEDKEGPIWEQFSKYNNVTVIDPDSSYDSYALGMRSDLVAHFSSFIGPELIFRGHHRVITLGPTEWESLDSSRHLRSRAEIENYVNAGIKRIPKIPIELLGFYRATFGEDFKGVSWDAEKRIWTFRKKSGRRFPVTRLLLR